MIRRLCNSNRKRLARGRHPSDEDLVLYLDSELAKKKAEQFREHLGDCWTCRVRAEELQRAIAAIVAHQNRTLAQAGGCPPGLRGAFEKRLSRLAAESRAEAGFPRLTTFPRMSWKLASVVIAGLLLLVWLSLTSVRAVSANEVLARSVGAQSEQLRRVTGPVVHQKLEVRRTFVADGTQHTASVETWNSAGEARMEQAGGAPLAAEVQSVLATNHMDKPWPLSAAAYGAWRDSVQVKEEKVAETRLPDGERAWRIQTAAAAAGGRYQALECALVVRARDWQPVQQKLKVRAENGMREVELSRRTFDVVARDTLKPDFFLESKEATPSAVPRPSGRPAAAALNINRGGPRSADLEKAEMEARCALHRVGACLRNPPEFLRQAGSGVIVRGLVETAERREELQRALAGVPFLKTEFKTVDEAVGPAVPSTGAETTRLMLRSTGLVAQKQLASYFVARYGAAFAAAAMARMADEAVTLSQKTLEEAWAVRHLAQAYPPERVSGLDLPYRWLLEAMVRDHAGAARSQLARVRMLLSPVFAPGPGAVATTEPEAGRSVEEGWQAESIQVLAAVERMDRLARGIFAGLPLREGETEGVVERFLAAASASEQLLQGFETRTAQEFAARGALTGSRDGNAPDVTANTDRRER